MSNFRQKVNTSIAANLVVQQQANKKYTAGILNRLFNDSVMRITYFDQMTHNNAAEVLMNASVVQETIILPRFINYYGCKVADTNLIALYYSVDEDCVVRACKYWQTELQTDGLLSLTRGEVHKTSKETDLDLAYAALDTVTYLLPPPRAIAKLAFVLPATVLVQAVIRECDKWFELVEADAITLPENNIISGTRLSPMQIAKYTAQAKVLRRYAYVGHFGDR